MEKGAKKGIVVCFPGTGFTCRETLFERCAQAYIRRGYDCLRLDFSNIPFKEIESLEEAVALAMRSAGRQMEGVHFEEYTDVVWISKSLGTICAAKAEKERSVHPRHLLLTPVPLTLVELAQNARVVARGLCTLDRFIGGEALANYCLERGYRYCLVEGVGHSLKDEADPARTERIIDQIAALCD